MCRAYLVQLQFKMAASLSSELSRDRRKQLTADRTGSVSASEMEREREKEREKRTDTANVCTR